MLSQDQLQNVLGQTAYGSDGAKLGKVGRVFLDNTSGLPEWVTVQTGLFGTRESFVPAGDAVLSDEGLTLPFSKDAVKDAPQVDADQGELSPEEEAELYRHYQLDYVTTADEDRTTDEYQATGQSTDDAMTLSEERLRVGTERVATGKARLRKYLVTEEQTITVPVTREEVRLEREPITDGNVAEATGGADLSEAEHEIVLTEERVIVTKETVPVERVKLAKETVTQDQQVTEQVRKERIETEGEIAGDVADLRSDGS